MYSKEKPREMPTKVGNALKYLRVNAGETAYEWATAGGSFSGDMDDIMVAATTVPTLKGNTAKTGGQLSAGAPSMGGTSNTGLTTALPATANAPATVTTSFWGCVN